MTAMTTIEHPWEGLVSGGIDARRVDSAGRWDSFWWVSERGEPALILRLAAGAEEIMPLPKMRSLDLRYRDIPGTRALEIGRASWRERVCSTWRSRWWADH